MRTASASAVCAITVDILSFIMGKRGPKKTPTRILKARGSWRADERKNEPEPDFSIPDMPNWLTDPVAKAEWRRIVQSLGRERILTRLDRTTLALYCQAYADYVESLDYLNVMVKGEDGKLKKAGPLVKTSKGNIIQNPALSVKNKAFQILLKIAAEFGLSPSSRSNIQVQQKPKQGRAKSSPFKVA